MRQSRFTEAQIIGMIKEQEAGIETAHMIRKGQLGQNGVPLFKQFATLAA